MVEAKWINPTDKEYQRTFLPSLSGIKGIAKDAKRGKTIRAVSQGNETRFIGIYT
jgi:hypothetical protein